MAKKTTSPKTTPKPNNQENWEEKAQQYLANWQRAQADFENHRKRSEEEKQVFIKFAHANLLLQILPVLDNFKRAAEHMPAIDQKNTPLKNWVDGVKSIEKQFEMILHNNGITPIIASGGETFDPNIHDAVSAENSDHPANTVLAEIEPGYWLHDKILRPAKVKVSRGKE